MNNGRHSSPDIAPAPVTAPPPERRPSPRARHATSEAARVEPFRILFVCTGNIHRSPMARSCLLEFASSNAPIEVSSAGTRAITGAPMAASSVAALRALGIAPAPHEAQQLRPELVARADLILTAEEAHAHNILAVTPTALRRTFTLLEFIRISAGAGLPSVGPSQDELRQRTLAIAACRGLVARADQPENIADPISAGQRQTAAIASEIRRCVHGAAAALGL